MGKAEFINRTADFLSEDYKSWLAELKNRYRQSQIKAALRVNGELLKFYWSLGRDIISKQAESKWGSGFLKNLSLDLQREFKETSGLSYSNLKYARQWYSFYYDRIVSQKQPSNEFRQQVVGGLDMPEIFGRIGWGII